MRRGIAVTILVLMVLATGCGQEKQVKVTYKSVPAGGMLYKQNGELWGACPMVLWYDIDDEAREKGYIEAKGLTVRWPDRSEKSSGELIKITVNGTERQVIFTQPRVAANAAVPCPE